MEHNITSQRKNLEHMKRLNIPVMFFGPASYNVAAAELMFADLKSTQLNPEGLQTGKKAFQKIIEMVVKRL